MPHKTCGKGAAMKVGAFLFDLDGTLVDTEAIWTRAIVDFVVSRGGETSFEEILPTVIGRNWIDIDRALHERFPVLGDSTAMEDARDLRAFYDRIAGDGESLVIRDSVEFFRRAAALAPCAIVSGSPHDDIIKMARLCGIEPLLKLVLGAGEYAAGKPDPSGYLKAASLLGVDPASCVVIEDSSVGVKAGVDAGMKVIALARPSLVAQTYRGETWNVPSLAEIDFDKEFS